MREPHDTTPRWGEAGIHGIARPREWDAVLATDLPGVEPDQLELVALPDGGAVCEPEPGPAALVALLAALRGAVPPPYAARAVRQAGDRFALAARRIEVVELTADEAGEEILLTVVDGERTVVVDGFPSFASFPTLERLGEARGPAYVVHALRLDRCWWRVEVTVL